MIPTTVSLFCGAGGESAGKELAFRDLGIHTTDILSHAVNHWDLAVAVHGQNFPHIHVHQEDITEVTARDFGLSQIDLLWASPSCVHHSRARGGKPRDDQQRSHADEVVDRWLRMAQVDVLLIENVAEFAEWGPLDEKGQPIKARKGEFFDRFTARLTALGYRWEWRILCAADYGDPTTRRRFFMQAVRDGRPIVWPEPTHRDPRKPVGLFGADLPTWRTAAECIDWSIPVPSIFDRKKPLADATLRRIAAGVMRYVVQGKPYIVNFRGTSPNQVQGSASGIDEPLRTVSAGGIHHGLIAASMMSIDQQSTGASACRAMDEPLSTATTKARHALVAAFIQHYYGTGGQHQDPGQPLHTITTLARHGLVTVDLQGQPYVIADIGMRMLEPHELAHAMGFPPDYRWVDGSGRPLTKRDTVKMIGNACPVNTVAALIKAVVLQRGETFGLNLDQATA